MVFRLNHFAISVCCFLLLASSIPAKTVIIDNLKPRLDVHGAIVNAHDGTIQQFEKGGLYYVHAAEYDLCREPTRYGCDQTADHCGFQFNHNISIWSSADLSSGSWKYVGNAIAMDKRPPGTVFRPHLVYNPTTKDYVLWWNYVTPQGQYNGYAVATASTPEGPFELRSSQVNVTRLHGGAGDYTLFVDTDGTGYVIYSAAFWMSIEKLTPDFLYSTGENATCNPGGANPALFEDYFVEAPALFQRHGVYYLLYGHCCCYCYQGSGIIIHTASHPLGPWKPLQNGRDIGCTSADWFLHAEPTPGQGCQYENPKLTATTRAQQNYVIEVPQSDGGDGDVQYIWTGDRWEQSPDGLKGHDPQFWVPLKFNDDGSIQDVVWVDQFSINV